MELLNHFGDGNMEDESFSEDDNVFQLLDHAYSLLEDGENPMKIIRMSIFIAILEMHHQEFTPSEMTKVFSMMANKFLRNYVRVNTQVDYGEE